MIRRLTLLTVAVASVAALVACSNSTSPSATLQSIVVSGTAPVKGASVQFTAIAMYSDGSTKDVTSTSTWATSDSTIATVTATGLVTGVGDGAATITATYGTMSSSDPVQITG
ncbi:MAG TPA: Ig-like domain-containing protein [Vicinamibacterales bacterium]|nr:Ig-like domain-containing protein [Vicinamibacterales bacterium]